MAAQDAGDFAGAERMAKALLAGQPDDVDALAVLVNAQDRQKNVHDYMETLGRLIALAPDRIKPANYRLFAKMQVHEGKIAAARATLAQAIAAYPGNLDLCIARAGLAGDLGSVCEELEAVIPAFAQNPVAVAALLNGITVNRAKLTRLSKGLPPDYGVSWDDSSTWSDPDGLERFRQVIGELMAQSQRGELVLDAACIAIHCKKWERADRILEVVRSQSSGSFADCTAFGSQFHAELERFDYETTVAMLPPVERLLEAPPQAPETLLLASDPNYFEQFTLPFIAALERMGIPADVQVHVMGGTPGRWREMAAGLDRFSTVRVSFSAEDSGPYANGIDNIRLYCHAIRFVRLFQEARRRQRRMWVFDVDVFLKRDPRPLLDRLTDFEVSIRTNPTLLTPVGRVGGNLIGIAPTPRGLEYARRVAAYILYWKERGTWAWGIDQCALDSAFVHLDRIGQGPRTYFQGADDVSNGVDGPCAFYFPTGANKYIAATKSAS